jgi:hypothetical protein
VTLLGLAATSLLNNIDSPPQVINLRLHVFPIFVEAVVPGIDA